MTMKLLRNLNHRSAFAKGTVATMGNFDGVHLGHQELLSQLKSQATKRQLPLVVLLFEPQPNEFFRGQDAPARLTSLREKLDRLAKCQVDYVVCLRFNRDLALMSALQFAQRYFFSLLQAKYLLLGEDFRFGHQRLGDINLLKELARENNSIVEIFPDFSIDQRRVSSTRVRETLALGQLAEAERLLGRSYSICGRVVRGNEQARLWGIPTANLAMCRKVLPLSGVFCVQVTRADGTLLNAVANLGRRPTLDGSKNVLEIHVFDFNENLYGELLKVELLYKLRDEIKFSSKEKLIEQIYSDVATAKAKFAAGIFEPIEQPEQH